MGILNVSQHSQIVKTALDIGEKILVSGGEVSRVEDTIERICKANGAVRVDVMSITISIVVTVEFSDGELITQTRRVYGQKYDLQALSRVNALSRKICETDVMPDEVEESLRDIENHSKYSLPIQILIYMITSAAFTVFFDGSVMDALASAVIGMILKLIDESVRRKNNSPRVMLIFCSIVGGFLANIFVAAGFGDAVDKINIGNIMLLIPGLAMTNSLRDMLTGNTITGLLRFFESALIAMIIALCFAVSGFLGIAELTNSVSEGISTLSLIPADIAWLVSAFMGTLGFSLFFNMHGKNIMWAALGGVIAEGIYILFSMMGMNLVVTYFAAAAGVTIYAEIMARIKKTPVTLFLVTGSIPLIPGGMLYATAQMLVQSDSSGFALNAVNTLLTAVAIAAGIVAVSIVTDSFKLRKK